MDFGDVLKSLAPTVASVLGGPLAGMAVTALGGIFGMSEPTQDKIADVIRNGQMTPEQVSALKALEMKYQAEEKERQFKYSELEFKDRDSARNMQVATRSVTPEFLSWLIIGATLALEGYVLTQGIPTQVSDLVAGRILGTLDMAFGTVLAFWLGSSFSSRQKDATILQQTAK